MDVQEPAITAVRDGGLAGVASAMRRVETVLQRRPDRGLHDDAPATVRWATGLGMVARHANGTSIATDMPAELGGAGMHVTPGWMFRAGLASCAATCIAMGAAAAGIALRTLEVEARSRSDARGLFGMPGADGAPVGAGPTDVQLDVRISAAGVAEARLREVVQQALRCSPIPLAVQRATPIAVSIDVDG